MTIVNLKTTDKQMKMMRRIIGNGISIGSSKVLGKRKRQNRNSWSLKEPKTSHHWPTQSNSKISNSRKEHESQLFMLSSIISNHKYISHPINHFKGIPRIRLKNNTCYPIYWYKEVICRYRGNTKLDILKCHVPK